MLPAQRQSHGRSRRRRSHHALDQRQLGVDPLSGTTKAHHRASAESGYVRPGLKIKVRKLGIGMPRTDTGR